MVSIHIPLMFWKAKPFSFVLEAWKILFGVTMYPYVCK